MQHVWVANAPESIPAGLATCVEGPHVLPQGASIFYEIGDTMGDNMDVSVVANGSPCDGSSGYAVVSSTNWTSSATSTTNPLSGGSYSLAITCYNLIDDCTPYLYVFGFYD